MNNSEKTLKQKDEALKQKGKIPYNWLWNWYDKQRSQRKKDERYWVLIFTKPYEYEHNTQEQIWYTKIYIWDTHEEKWKAQITTHDKYPYSYFHIDYQHEKLVVVDAFTVNVYSFEDTTGTNVITIKCEADVERFISVKFIDSNTLFIDAAKNTWHLFFLKEKKEYMYANGKDISIAKKILKIVLLSDSLTAIIVGSRQDMIGPYKITLWERTSEAIQTDMQFKRYIWGCQGDIRLSNYEPTEKTKIFIEGKRILIDEISMPLAYIIYDKTQ